MADASVSLVWLVTGMSPSGALLCMSLSGALLCMSLSGALLLGRLAQGAEGC